jgi:hypothetical protein
MVASPEERQTLRHALKNMVEVMKDDAELRVTTLQRYCDSIDDVTLAETDAAAMYDEYASLCRTRGTRSLALRRAVDLQSILWSLQLVATERAEAELRQSPHRRVRRSTGIVVSAMVAVVAGIISACWCPSFGSAASLGFCYISLVAGRASDAAIQRALTHTRAAATTLARLQKFPSFADSPPLAEGGAMLTDPKHARDEIAKQARSHQLLSSLLSRGKRDFPAAERPSAQAERAPSGTRSAAPRGNGTTHALRFI